MPSVLREVGETFEALVKGFSVTFRNIFRKTVTENYPHEPVHFQPRYRGIHVLHRDESGVWDAFCALRPALPIAFTSKQRKIRMRPGFPRASDTQPYTTLIIRDAFFVGTAWRRVRRTPSHTAMGLSWLRTTSILWFTAKSSSSKKQRQFPQAQHANSSFISLIVL